MVPIPGQAVGEAAGLGFAAFFFADFFVMGSSFCAGEAPK
jgi:hypothetical protein